jgi:phosphoesterase family protein
MTRRRRFVTTFAATALITGTLGASAVVGHAAPRDHRSVPVMPAGRARAAAAAAGTNLLVNPGAEVGGASQHGWAAVTIPGWRITSGLPTVVRYGNSGFPGAKAAGPAHRGRQMFVGGAGGKATLIQRVALLTPAGGALAPRTSFRLSAWVGGSTTSHTVAQVRFFSAAGRALGASTTPAVSQAQRGADKTMVRRAVSGQIPAGARTAKVIVRLDTSLTNDDGPDAPMVGYNRALADNVSFSVGAKVRRPPALVPPVARVPRYDHVFVYYFENQDYKAIIGNTKQAPYFNSLISNGSLLANTYAEEHPSDGNYLAFAGGSTFGIPLTDPLEEDPTYTINARNLGDLIVGAGESWKDYAQSANGPCDDTVHGQYWNDDPEFMYFKDVRLRPKYCAAHLVPLTELGSDLASTTTTPSFSWVEPNDCTDMEGCGIKAGDTFLTHTLGQIMASPAWTTQRSLVIITFDEDAYNHERPAQRVATIVLGSKDVRRGFVSHTRYTHYSLLRTVEAALGLGTLTRNDKYAQPLNDVFHVAS